MNSDSEKPETVTALRSKADRNQCKQTCIFTRSISKSLLWDTPFICAAFRISSHASSFWLLAINQRADFGKTLGVSRHRPQVTSFKCVAGTNCTCVATLKEGQNVSVLQQKSIAGTWHRSHRENGTEDTPQTRTALLQHSAIDSLLTFLLFFGKCKNSVLSHRIKSRAALLPHQM